MKPSARAGGRGAYLGLLVVFLSACGDTVEEPLIDMAGTYLVDKEHYRLLMMVEVEINHGPEAVRPDLASIGLFLEQLQLDLIMKADGSWTLRGSLGMQAVDDAGTWTVSGDEIAFRFTQQQGRPTDKTIVGTRAADGVLLVRTSPDQLGPFRMVRQ